MFLFPTCSLTKVNTISFTLPGWNICLRTGDKCRAGTSGLQFTCHKHNSLHQTNCSTEILRSNFHTANNRPLFITRLPELFSNPTFILQMSSSFLNLFTSWKWSQTIHEGFFYKTSETWRRSSWQDLTDWFGPFRTTILCRRQWGQLRSVLLSHYHGHLDNTLHLQSN